jgi:hypothetical protein
MRNGICSKCGNQDVRVGKQESTSLGQATTVLGLPAVRTDVAVNYDVYVCLYCGYVELGISDPTAIQKIAAQWPRITPPPSPQQPG